MNKKSKLTQRRKNPISQAKHLHLKYRKWKKTKLKKCNNDCTGGLVIGYEKEHKLESIYHLSEDVHSLIIGATRSGKSRRIVLQSISYMALDGESMVINDPKGELAAYTTTFLKRMEYEIILIDFKNPLKSSCYNFLQPIIDAVNQDDIAKAVDLTWDITTSLAVEKGNGESIWINGERSVIASSIMSVVFDNKENPQFQNLTNVYYFIANMCKAENNQMPIDKYLKDISDNHPAKGLFAIAQIAPSRTRSSFFTSALTTLQLFTNKNIYAQTSSSDFILHETGSKKRAVFIILPDEKTTFYSLASLFVYQHYVALVEVADNRGGRLENRTNFIIDEFGNFTKIPSFANMLTVGGGRGIRFNLFVQSFAQIEETYGKESSETVKSNCHCWVYLKTSDETTPQTVSKKLGQYTTSTYSRSSSYNSSGGSNANISNSMNLMARPLLTEDEVSRIEYPYVLVMHSGYHPAIMELPDISDWLFNKILGLGDKEHNRILREYREKKRIPKKAKDIELWNIWKTYDESEKTEQKKDTPKQTGTGVATLKPKIRTPAPSEHSKSEIEMQEVDSFTNTNVNKKWKTGAEMIVSGENIVELFESMKQGTKNKNNEKRIDVL